MSGPTQNYYVYENRLTFERTHTHICAPVRSSREVCLLFFFPDERERGRNPHLVPRGGGKRLKYRRDPHSTKALRARERERRFYLLTRGDATRCQLTVSCLSAPRGLSFFVSLSASFILAARADARALCLRHCGCDIARAKS